MTSQALVSLTNKLATTLNMGDGTGLVETLKATAFKGQVSDAQMTALLVVANAYGLNPWTKEIYAFPDKQNGIVPVVGVDGWSRIINSHPQFDGMEFDADQDSCTCKIFRKDRSHPISVTEYLDECYRQPIKTREGGTINGPWQSHPKRMLRHKAMIQCARLAFGFAGIFDQDEAERIAESAKTVDPSTGEIVTFNLEAALKEVIEAKSEEQLAEVWKRRVAECNAAKAKDDYAVLKQAVAKRGKELKEGLVTDVNPKMSEADAQFVAEMEAE